MNKSFLLFLLIIFGAFSMTSCRFLDEEKAKNDQFTSGSGELNIDCTISPDAFDQITKRYISSELECLKRSLEVFSKGVKTKKSGYLSKSSLSKVIKKFYSTNSPEKTIRGIDLLFKADAMIFNGDDEFVKRENINKFIDFLSFFNRKYVHVIKPALELEETSFQEYQMWRRRVSGAVKEITGVLKSLYVKNRSNITYLGIPYLIDHIEQGVLESEPGEQRDKKLNNLKKMRSLLFIKRLFFGGRPYHISHFEFERLLAQLPTVITAVYDMGQVKKIDFGSEKYAKFKILENAFTLIRKQIYYSSDSQTPLFSIFDVLKSLKHFEDLFGMDVSDLDKEAMEVKMRVLQGHPETFFMSDIDTIFSHIKRVLSQTSYTLKMYQHFEDLMDLRTPFTSEHLEKFKSYPVDTEFGEEQFVYKDQFIRIAMNYRFYQNIDLKYNDPADNDIEKIIKLARFDYKIQRTAEGMGNAVMSEYLMMQLMRSYGEPSNDPRAIGGYTFGVFDIVDLAMKFKRFLEKQGMWKGGPNGVQTMAENSVLMADLFQHQSNGSGRVELNEAAEYLLIAAAAGGVGQIMLDKLKRDDCTANAGSIELKCVNRNFFRTFKPFDSFVPHLRDHLADSGENEQQKFLITTELFARDFPESNKVSKRDFLLIFGAMLNIESTILRFDTSIPEKVPNGEMDYDELKNAWKVYKNAIFGIINMHGERLPEGGSTIGIPNEKLAESAFFFLVKNQREPCSDLELFFFHLFGNKKKIVAGRQTIAGLLRYIAESSKLPADLSKKERKKLCKEKKRQLRNKSFF